MSLKLIKEEKINRKIKKGYKYTFSVDQSGIYAITVSARARSWFQNLTKSISFFRDDNLELKINGTGFPKLSGARGEFNGEASYCGRRLDERLAQGSLLGVDGKWF